MKSLLDQAKSEFSQQLELSNIRLKERIGSWLKFELWGDDLLLIIENDKDGTETGFEMFELEVICEEKEILTALLGQLHYQEAQHYGDR